MKKTFFSKSIALFLSVALLISTFLLLPVSATSIQDFRDNYAGEITVLESVTDAGTLVEKITSDNAQGFMDAYAAYQELSDTDKNTVLTNSDLELDKKLEAASKRAGIWLNGVFDYNRITDADLGKYLLNKGIITAVLYTGYAADLDMDISVTEAGGWCYSLLKVEKAGGDYSPEFIYGAEKSGDNLIAKLQDFGWAKGKGINIIWKGVRRDLVDLTNGTGMILGTYDGDNLTSYNTTLTHKFTKKSDGTYKTDFTWNNNHGDIRYSIDLDASLSEDNVKNGFYVYTENKYISAYHFTYPEIKSEINLKKIAEFCANYTIWTDTEKGNYNTPQRLVDSITADNGISIYNQITAFKNAVDSADSSIKDAIISTDVYTNILAMEKRAGIFATAKFDYNRITDADLEKYLLDKGTITAVLNTGYAADLDMDISVTEAGGWCYSLLKVEKAGGDYSPEFIYGAEKSGDNLIAKLQDFGWAKGKGINIIWKGVRRDLVDLTNGTGMILGTYDGDNLTSYTTTLTHKFTKKSDGTYKTDFTWNNNHGDVRYSIDLDASLSADNVKNGFYAYTDNKFISGYHFTYPEAEKNLNDIISKSFAENYPIMNDIHSGKFENVSKLVSEITINNASDILSSINEVEKDLSALSSDVQNAVKQSDYWDSNTVTAIKRRAEIFTKGEFNWNVETEPELENFFVDSNKRLMIISNIGAIPAITFKKKLAQSAVDMYQSDEEVMQIGNASGFGHIFRFYSKPSKDTESGIVYATDRTAGWGPKVSLISATNGGVYSALYDLKNGNDTDSSAQFGIYSGDQFNSYENTMTLTFDKNTETNQYQAYGTFNDNHGFTSSGNVGKYSTDEVLNEVTVNIGEIYELSSINVQYSSIKEYITLEAPTMNGATVKIASSGTEQDLRFNASLQLSENENFTPISYGFVMIKSSDLNDTLTIDNSDVLSKGKKIEFDILNSSDFSQDFHASILATGLISDEDIAGNLDTKYSARAYVLYKDKTSGHVYTIYSNNNKEENKITDGVSSRSINQVVSAIGNSIKNQTIMIGDSWVFADKTDVQVNTSYGNTNLSKSEIECIIEKNTDLTMEEISKLLTFCINNRSFAIK